MNTEHFELHKRLKDYTPDEADAFPFSERLARDNGWSLPYARRVIQEYKRFAFLSVAAGHPVTPSDEVDQAWHLHMLYTASYWKDFCGTVLGKPLHHQPTKGGEHERDKFQDWYNRTIESYRHFFNEEPPPDIWPEARRRFGSDQQFVRINTSQHWIIPKRASLRMLKGLCVQLRSSLAWRGGWSAAATALAVCGAGCGSTVGSTGSPFDLRGGDFIQFFLVLWIVNVGLATWLRWSLREPAEESGAEPVELDSYAVAYLSSNDNLAVNAALANLVHVGALKAAATEPRLLRASPLPASTHLFEQGVYEGVAPETGSTIAEIREHARPRLRVIDDQLKALGLLVSRSQSVKIVLYPLLLALLVPAVGLIKIDVGLSRAKPVGFLIVLCAVSVLVALAGFARRPRRSRRGDRVLAGLKATHSALQSDGLKGQAGVASINLPLAVGLFGMCVLANTSLADLQKKLSPKPGRDSCGGGCGGIGGGDGGGGGGCGGCGGCGG